MASSSRSSITSFTGPLMALLLLEATVTLGAGIARCITMLNESGGQQPVGIAAALFVMAIGLALALFQLAVAVALRLLSSSLAQTKYDQAVMDQLRTNVLQIEQIARSQAAP